MKALLLLLAVASILSCASCREELATPAPDYTFELYPLPNGQIGINYESDIYGWKILIGKSVIEVSGATSYIMIKSGEKGCSNMRHDRISTPMYFRVISSDGVIDEVKKI